MINLGYNYSLNSVGAQTIAVALQGKGDKPLPILQSTIRINQNISDPATMISGDVNGEAIKAIRANSHRYLCKYTGDGEMTICQLDDANSNYYYDGSPAILTGSEGDVMMGLPRFYTLAKEVEPDIWDITFAYGEKPSEEWKEWGGNDLIGVYKGSKSENKLYSHSDVTPAGNINYNSTYASDRGNGYTFMRLSYRNIMAFLFYAMYGNTNSQVICGKGCSTSNGKTGLLDNLGMTDTTPELGNTIGINFWGLENWWSSIQEVVYNVYIPSGNTFCIYENYSNTNYRTLVVPTKDGYITKIHIGEYLDIIPKSTGGSSTTGYCDNFMAAYNANPALKCGGDTNKDSAGIVSGRAYEGGTYPNFGTRLCFTGNLIPTKDVEYFKSIPIIN